MESGGAEDAPGSTPSSTFDFSGLVRSLSQDDADDHHHERQHQYNRHRDSVRSASAAATAEAEGQGGGFHHHHPAGWQSHDDVDVPIEGLEHHYPIQVGMGGVGGMLGAGHFVGGSLNTGAGGDDPNEGSQNVSPLRMVVFSGGTAFNTVAAELQRHLTTSVSHVLPVSDDGGSTAEIVRVLGGPAVGDIRSRCLRLSDESTAEARAVKRLLGHRLVSAETFAGGGGGGSGSGDGAEIGPERVARAAKEEWLSIIEGDRVIARSGGGDDGGATIDLWENISAPYRDTIRAFLVHFHYHVLSSATERFDFTGGSVGNFFFAGARVFFRSMSAAVFLYSRVSGIPPETKVLPAVITEDRLTLGAVLEDGSRMRGQHNISHPSPPSPPSTLGRNLSSLSSASASVVDKAADQAGSLPSPIRRVAYLFHDRNQPRDRWDDKQQVHPETNPLVLEALDEAGAAASASAAGAICGGGGGCIVYGMGSLYTSIVPALILDGVGEGVARRCSSCPKFLLLNGWHDRETSWGGGGGGGGGGDGDEIRAMDAAMFVGAIVDALDASYRRSQLAAASRSAKGCGGCGDDDDDEEGGGISLPPVTDYVTHVLYPRGGEVAIGANELDALCRSRSTAAVPPRPSSSRRSRRSTRLHHDHHPHHVRVVEVASVPADAPEGGGGAGSGGRPHHRVFDSGALVQTLRKLMYEWDLARLELNTPPPR